MGKSPEEIRAEIEATRAGLGADVDALANKVSPTAVVGRRVDAVRGALGAAKTSVMGSTASIGDELSVASSSVTDAASSTPDAAKSAAAGNPLAAGLIAFGAGWLLSSLLPVSRSETRAATQLKENSGALTQGLRDAAQDAKESLLPKAQEALDQVKDSGTSAVSELKDAASDSASNVQTSAAGATEQVKTSVS